MRMGLGQGVQNFLSLGCELQNHPPPIVLGVSPCDQTSLFTPFAKLHDAVMTDTEALCSVADRHRHAIRHPSNLKQKLMLLRLKATAGSRLFAKPQEAPEVIPKLGEDLQTILGCSSMRGWHPKIISYRDMFIAGVKALVCSVMDGIDGTKGSNF